MGKRSVSGAALALLGLGSLVACGTGAVGSAVRPDATTANTALGETTCHHVEAEGHPLIVDWSPEARSDLEIAMKQGVALVHYDCESIKLARDCHLGGSYGFIGTSTQQKVVELDDADEIRANLPFGGVALAGKIGGDLARGSSLDLALIYVGQKTTTVQSPLASDLTGSCAGVTHFVRAVHVGAFAMDTGTKGQARAAVEMFGAGTSASSSSSRDVKTRDGSLESCAQANPDAPSPPAQCGAPLRIELLSVAGALPVGGPGPVNPQVPALVDDGCPQGLVFTQGKCAAPGPQPFQCDSKNASQCAEQCTKGSADSCYSLGWLYYVGQGGLPKDQDGKAVDFYKRACDGGSLAGCTEYAYGLERKHDAAGAFALTKKTCEAGFGEACRRLSTTYYSVGIGTPKNDALALAAAVRGCNAGSGWSCSIAGADYLKGVGAPKDGARAEELYQRACESSPGAACDDAASLLLKGDGAPKDPARALAIYDRECNQDGKQCVAPGRVYELGFGVPVDVTKAFGYYDRACNAGAPLGCTRKAVLQIDGRGTTKDEAGGIAFLKHQCDAKDASRQAACGELARRMLDGRGVPKEPERAVALVLEHCAPDHKGVTYPSECAPLGIAYADGNGVAKDNDKAIDAFQRACSPRFSASWDPEPCQRLEALGGKPK